MAAQYLVSQDPGAEVPTIGRVRPGEVFTAPAGYTPSITLFPVNEEAQAELVKVFETQKALLEKRLNRSSDNFQLEEELRVLEERRQRAFEILTPRELADFHERGAVGFRKGARQP